MPFVYSSLAYWNLLKIDCQVGGQNWMSKQAYNLPVALWREILEDVVSLRWKNDSNFVKKLDSQLEYLTYCNGQLKLPW